MKPPDVILSENDLASGFRQHLPFYYRSRKTPVESLIVAEVEGPFRRADFVQIDWFGEADRSASDLARLTCFRSPVAARAYLLLRQRRRLSLDQINAKVGFERATVASHLRNLVSSSWILRHGHNCYELNPALTLPEFTLTTFELKLHDWRRAQSQVSAHRLFADRVVLVMLPPARTSTAAIIRDSMDHLGVSLIYASGEPDVVLWQRSPVKQRDRALEAMARAVTRHLEPHQNLP